MDIKELLIEGCKKFDLEIDSKITDDFFEYKNILTKWNEVMNLTTIIDPTEIIIKHFVDSISLLKFTDLSNSKVIDVGTGAGFPGLPLKIADNSINLTLLDSLKKRTNFLLEVCNNLKLNNVNIIHGRAEEFGIKKEYREEYDVSLSRAVARLSILSEYCLPFVKVGGYFISLKGPDINDELNESKKAIDILGGKVEDVKKVVLPYFDIEHSIVLIKKVRQTPSKYPRNAGKPTKQPII